MATSGPSEPWRNADDFADYIAAKGEGKAPGGVGVAAFGNSEAATAAVAATRAGGKGNTLVRRGKATTATATAAAVAAAPPSTPSMQSMNFSPARGVGGGGDRGRGSPGFHVGERKGGALYDGGQDISDGGGDGAGLKNDVGGPLHGANGVGGGNREGSCTMFDSIGVDLGST